MLEESYSYAIVSSNFPHVGKIIKTHWDDPDFMTYMDDLLYQDKHRRGFPSSVSSALRSLVDEHDVEFPQFTHADHDF